jgi:uncharacterized RDD family membrane protein YckC
MSTTQQAQSATRPGAFDRLFALVIDFIIVVVPVALVAELLFDQLASLGEYGPIVGASVVALYFGYFDSRLGGGRSPGKRCLGLMVVNTHGALISPAPAAARALVLELCLSATAVAPTTIPSTLTAGLMIAFYYLAIFNRPSGRSIHDLATGTMVVFRCDPIATPLPVWKFHWAILAVLLIAILADPMWFLRASDASKDEIEMNTIRLHVATLPELRSVRIRLQEPTQSKKKDKRVIIAARLRHDAMNKKEIADAIASSIYRGSENLLADTLVTVELVWGYDLGIASRSTGTKNAAERSAHPQELR